LFAVAIAEDGEDDGDDESKGVRWGDHQVGPKRAEAKAIDDGRGEKGSW
jgi:hypothetical protein